MAFFQACRKSYEAASARRKIVRLTEKLPFLRNYNFLQNCQIWLKDFLKIDISEVFGEYINFSVEFQNLSTLPILREITVRS